MKMRAVCAVVILACCCGYAVGQTGAGTKAVAGAAMSPATAEDDMLHLFEEEFTAAAKAMPADKYSFAPASGAIAGSRYDGVRTFAAEVTHVAQANYYFFSTITGTKPDVDMASFKSMTDKDQILQMLASSFAYAHAAIATITPANAFVTIQGADGMHTRVTVASFAVAHGYDHYGQMIEYLRMNGIVPPGSK